MRVSAHSQTDSSRRQFLQAFLSTAVVGVAVQAGIELAAPEYLSAQTNMSPDAALQELLAGNQRFAANQLTSIEHDLTTLRDRTVAKQEPFAGVLSCADSRVPAELIFDQTPEAGFGAIRLVNATLGVPTWFIPITCQPCPNRPARAEPRL